MIASELNLGSIDKHEEGTGQQVLHVFLWNIYFLFFKIYFKYNILK